MRGVSSGVAADLQSGGFSELAGRRAGAARYLAIRSGVDGPWAGKLLSVIGTVLAITAGPLLANLLEHPLPPNAQYNSDSQLRGSIAFNSDFQLRGSIR